MTPTERATLRHSLVCAALTGLLSNGSVLWSARTAPKEAVLIADETMKQLYGGIE